MLRLIEKPILADLREKLVLLSGPRQVGKTTVARQLSTEYDYFNFDAADDRRRLLEQAWDRDCELVIFDELHKMKKWKRWVKGVFDTETIPPGILVTGSARMAT